MVAFVKALPFGLVLTVIVALFMGSGGATGGLLDIFDFEIEVMDFDIELYWSWTLFSAGTGLTWALILMMGD